MNAVTIDEVREARRAANASDTDDLFMGILEFFQDLVEGGEDGKVSTARAPRWVVSGENFLGQLFLGRFRG